MLGETSHTRLKIFHSMIFYLSSKRIVILQLLTNCEMCQTISYYRKQQACESYVFKIIRFSSYYELKAFMVTGITGVMIM